MVPRCFLNPYWKISNTLLDTKNFIFGQRLHYLKHWAYTVGILEIGLKLDKTFSNSHVLKVFRDGPFNRLVYDR